MPKTQAEIFADDRPTSCDQTLYQWAVDAEELIREQAAWLTRLLANLENSERIASTRKETIASYKRAMDASQELTDIYKGNLATYKALVDFLLTADEPMAFLKAWREGAFDTCKREWPEAPMEVYP